VSRSLAQLEDEVLLDRFNAGEAEAFAVLLERYRRPIYNFILRSTRDQELAEDVLQEVFMRVVQRAGDFRHSSKFSTWLYTIARNLCIDTSRKMAFRRHRSLDAPLRGDDGDGPTLLDRVGDRAHVDRTAISAQIGAAVATAVEALPEEQREVFLMRQVQALPFKEIAEIVGVPENTIKSRMRYALERLREALAEYDDYLHELK
jgi:RNA polymerase sigma-70 factor (ECF subfamily)